MRSRRGRLRPPRWLSDLPAVSAAGVAGLVGVAGWGTAGASDAPPRPVRAVVENDGLRVTVTATGSGTSATLRFTVSAIDAHAHGALGYDVAFGDGTSTSNAVPQFCVAGSGISQHDIWHLTHHYAVGTYHVTVTVRVNCTKAVATARLTVRAK